MWHLNVKEKFDVLSVEGILSLSQKHKQKIIDFLKSDGIK